MMISGSKCCPLNSADRFFDVDGQRIRRPESVRNTSGLFDLEAQPEMLFQFEATGAEASWEFRMPKGSNLFDYGTIADVLITFEYTALDSSDYRHQVISSWTAPISADRPFSIRYQYSDEWYKLNNPDQYPDNPMEAHLRFHGPTFLRTSMI
jgi:hypothetical protein